jgi:hypothetical protein
MPHNSNGAVPRLTADDADILPSRRRPDRVNDLHPSLIPLLRGSFGPTGGDPDRVVSEVLTMPANVEVIVDDLAAARGIVLGAALCAPIWTLLSLGIYVLLH